MSFITRYGPNAVIALDPEFASGKWIVTAYPEITSSPYDLDEGKMTVGKYAPSLLCTSVISEWMSKKAPGCTNMYVTSVSARMLAGGIWMADLTIKGGNGKKYCRVSPTTSLKEMTVTRDDKTDGFNAVTPGVTYEYLSGPGISVDKQALPPSPPGFSFTGKAKTNSPSGWVRMEATAENLEGTPFKKITEKYQWIHSAEPAS